MTAGATRRIADLIGPPLAVWLVATAVVCITAWIAGYPPHDAGTWIRWDSGHYLGIAREGYTLFPCSYDKTLWCGNASWFPGYPWLIAASDAAGLSPERSAVAIAWLFRLATLVLIWLTYLGRKRTATTVGVLALAAFAPGGIYGFAAFPISLLWFTTLVCIWLLYRRRWLAAGVAAAAAVLVYPVGLVLIFVGALWPFLARSTERPGARLRHAATVAGLGLAAAFLVSLVQRVEVGSWRAYRLVQDKYGVEFQLPIRPTGHAIYELFTGALSSLGRAGPALNTLLVTAILIAVLIAAFRQRDGLSDLDRLLILWAIPAWTVATFQTGISLYRSQATLLPLILLAHRLPRPVLYTLVVLAAAVTVVMTKLFVDSTLM